MFCTVFGKMSVYVLEIRMNRVYASRIIEAKSLFNYSN